MSKLYFSFLRAMLIRQGIVDAAESSYSVVFLPSLEKLRGSTHLSRERHHGGTSGLSM